MRHACNGLLLLTLLTLLLTPTGCGSPNSQDLIEAAETGDTAAVQALLDEGADVNVKHSSSGVTALHRPPQELAWVLYWELLRAFKRFTGPKENRMAQLRTSEGLWETPSRNMRISVYILPLQPPATIHPTASVGAGPDGRVLEYPSEGFLSRLAEGF